MAAFLDGLADGFAVLGLGGATALLLARLFGLHASLHPAWCAALLVPPVLASWRAWRTRFSRGAAAAWVDRQGRLQGLLLAGIERDLGAWRGELQARLAAAPPAMPRLRWRRLLARAALPMLLLAGAAAIPAPPAPNPPVARPALQEELARLDSRVEVAVEQGVLDEREGEEVRAELEEFRERLRRGDAVEWSDVDALDERLTQANTAHAAALQRTRARLAELTRRASAEGADGSRLAEQLAETLRAASADGLLDELPPDLRDRLGAGRGNAPLDAASLPQDPARLAELARALDQALRGELTDLARAELLDPSELQDLAQALGEFSELEELEEVTPHEHTEACAGGT